MLSYIKDLFNYLFNINYDNEDDNDKEDFLAQELVELDIQIQKEEDYYLISQVKEPHSNANCITKTGVITYGGDNFVLIDGMIYYDTTDCTLKLNVNDKVLYLGYKDSNDSIVIVRILENQGSFWGDDNELDEKSFDIVEHVLVGYVARRQDRIVYISESDLKFNLDNVEGTFVPVEGDWLEMKCSVQQNDLNLSDISANKVLKVITFKPLRSKFITAFVTQCSGTTGIIDGKVYFDVTSLTNGAKPAIGSKVQVEAIESNQGSCIWRALRLKEILQASEKELQSLNEEQISLNLEKEKCISLTHPLQFENVKLNETNKRVIKVNLRNDSNNLYVFNKWIMLSRKRDSQIHINPFISQPMKLLPGKNLSFTVTCNPKFFGHTRECLVLLFKGFNLKRFVEIHIVNNEHITNNSVVDHIKVNKLDTIKAMKNIRDNVGTYIPGVRVKKIPPFINVRIGSFFIPDKIWSIILMAEEKTIYRNNFEEVVSRLEMSFPFLAQDLTIGNYIDRWHTLLYLEEVQNNLYMRNYDKKKVFLIHCNEYLGIEMTGLAERKPSLLVGDKGIVKDIWNPRSPHYQGIIHGIRGNLILMKFSPQFHEMYCGGDVSIEFYFSRTAFRRSHHAINIAISNLGPDILFPSRVNTKPIQVQAMKNINKIKWFNSELNTEQKNAVVNIIKGECRPLPYIIFGPPGTGKTITVIETILQILTLIPESRILIATPSNSASNLITERLIHYKDFFTGSIVRLLANYLVDSGSISNVIKPFCATLDISSERSSERKNEVKDNINLNCQKSVIGRHRVTIGTCFCLGSLHHLGFPKGHFTHIIVDEAGQASEPEIMLPLTFTDKNHGQIILAGDPMQLGPVVHSQHSKVYGMEVSFLSRLLDRFPYLKDYHSYVNGFDNRLVTKLNENYRSLKEIIDFPSEMFYDGTLVAKVNESMAWTKKFINATGEILDSTINTGGTFIYGIKGINIRAEDSPSWYNPQEASMVALTICKLYKKNITPDEIGILTPYVAQVKYLRTLCNSMGLPHPKIGTVEDFQGQERPIIIISTVRSNQSYVDEDIKYALGFVSNPKRINVALTRAQISTIIFCNPHLMCKDILWKKIIMYVVSSGKYMGCDLPHEFDDSNNIE